MGLLPLWDLKPQWKVTIEVRTLQFAKKILGLMYKRSNRSLLGGMFWGPTRPWAAFLSLHRTPGHQVWIIVFLCHIQFPWKVKPESPNQVSLAFTGHRLWVDPKAIPWPVGCHVRQLGQPRELGGRTQCHLKHTGKRQTASRTQRLCGRRETRYLCLRKMYPNNVGVTEEMQKHVDNLFL